MLFYITTLLAISASVSAMASQALTNVEYGGTDAEAEEARVTMKDSETQLQFNDITIVTDSNTGTMAIKPNKEEQCMIIKEMENLPTRDDLEKMAREKGNTYKFDSATLETKTIRVKPASSDETVAMKALTRALCADNYVLVVENTVYETVYASSVKVWWPWWNWWPRPCPWCYYHYRYPCYHWPYWFYYWRWMYIIKW